jgi:GntR family transcriptional regulator, N-acetylglucosamine utilization regulator
MATQRVSISSGFPRYYQISETIRQKIESHEWAPHQKLPTERELEKLYGVSRAIIRNALGTLVRQGYLYQVQGRGTFVSRPKLDLSLLSLSSFTDDIKARGLEPSQVLLSLRYEPVSTFLRYRLELGSEINQVLRIERLRLANAEPIGIHNAYVPLPQGETITPRELEQTGSLYKILADKYGLVPANADETLEAAAAGDREAQLLRVPPGSPLLVVERTTWSVEQKPMEFVKMLYRGDRYKYFTHLHSSTDR